MGKFGSVVATVADSTEKNDNTAAGDSIIPLAL